MAALLLVAGLVGPPALVARSLALQSRLPGASAAIGFSGLSAAAGAGTSAAGLLSAPLLHAAGTTPTLLTALGLSAAAALVSRRGEVRQAAMSVPVATVRE